MRQKDLRGRNEAFIDMGLSNLLAVAVSSGLGILVKGVSSSQSTSIGRRRRLYYKKNDKPHPSGRGRGQIISRS